MQFSKQNLGNDKKNEFRLKEYTTKLEGRYKSNEKTTLKDR